MSKDLAGNSVIPYIGFYRHTISELEKYNIYMSDWRLLYRIREVLSTNTKISGLSQHNDLTTIYNIYSDAFLFESLKQHLVKLINKSVNTGDIKELQHFFPDHLKQSSVLIEAIHVLLCEKTGLDENTPFTRRKTHLAGTAVTGLSIVCLELSTRVYHALRRAGIDTVGQLVSKTDKELLGINLIGAVAVEEIHRQLDAFFRKGLSDYYCDPLIVAGSSDFCRVLYGWSPLGADRFIKELQQQVLYMTQAGNVLESLVDMSKDIDFILFKYKDFLVEDIETDDFVLSDDMSNLLSHLSLSRVLDVFLLDKTEFDEAILYYDMPSSTIWGLLNDLLYVKCRDDNDVQLTSFADLYNSLLPQFVASPFYNYIDDFWGLLDQAWFSKFTLAKFIVGDPVDVIKNFELMYEFWLNSEMESKIVEFLSACYDHDGTVFDLQTLKTVFPEFLFNIGLINKILDDMVFDEILRFDGHVYWFRKEKLIDCLNNIGGRTKDIIIDRLSGQTLANVGLTQGLSRERIRQIIFKFFDSFSGCREDEYKDVFEKYEWTSDIFTSVYDENIIVYNYLVNKYDLGVIELSEILYDTTVDFKIRECIADLLHKDFILTEQGYLSRDKASVIRHILETKAKETISADQLEAYYYGFLHEYGLDSDEAFFVKDRYFLDTVSLSSYVLWSYPSSLRYYDITKVNQKDLVKCLCLHEYHNVEIAAHLLFRKHPSVMNNLDIRSGYELHNLMRKLWINQFDDYKLRFGRMPMLAFGDIDRNEQVMDLLRQYAPISIGELAALYDKTYGVPIATVRATFFSFIRGLSVDGMFEM